MLLVVYCCLFMVPAGASVTRKAGKSVGPIRWKRTILRAYHQRRPAGTAVTHDAISAVERSQFFPAVDGVHNSPARAIFHGFGYTYGELGQD